MRPECISATESAIGRAITKQEAQNIEAKIYKAMRSLAKDDPSSWNALSKDERLQLAGERAAKELVHEAELKAKRAELTVVKTSALLDYARAGENPFDRIKHKLAFYTNHKDGTTSIEKEATAISNVSIGKLVSDPDYFDLISTVDGVTALTKELYSESSGNAAAKRIAKIFHDEANQHKNRFNRGGGDIGTLENWGLPQHHSQARVALAGLDNWVKAIMPKLNRNAFADENGVIFDDTQMMDFLKHAYYSIATNGENKKTPGASSSSSIANRGNAPRSLHFKDAQSYLDYQAEFGDRNLHEILTSHLRGIGKDIAIVEGVAPNADHTMRLVLDTLKQEAILKDPVNKGNIEKQANRTQNVYNELAGKHLPMANIRMAATFDAMRSWLVASKLGSAFISSFNDEATMAATAMANNISYAEVFRRELSALDPTNKTEKRIAMRSGLALNSILQDMHRYAQDSLDFGGNTMAERGARVSNKIASRVMKLSGLNLITDARKRAFGNVLMDAIGNLTNEHDNLQSLDVADRAMLEAKGVTDQHWSVWKLAKKEDWANGHSSVLTAQSIFNIPDALLQELGDPQILREQAASKLMAHVLEEVDTAIIEPGIRERSITQNFQRGTLTGELARSVLLFKSFPIAMLTRHWGRALKGEAGSKALYIATLGAMSTVIGAMANQVNELLNGRDPLDMTDERFIAKSLLKGGSLGIFGDFLYSDTTSFGNNSMVDIAAGPLVSTISQFDQLTRGNLIEAAQGKDTNAGAETIKFASGLTPGANLWYLKAALNHFFIQDIQEMASPGYLNKVKSRAMKDFKQSYWWQPADNSPDRAPDFAKALGN